MFISSFYVFALAAALPSGSIADSSLVAEGCTFGSVHPNTTAQCRVAVNNTGTTDRVIRRVVATSTNLKIEGLPLTVPAQGTRELDLSWKVGPKLGRRGIAARLSTTGPGDQEGADLMVRGSGFVYSVLDQTLQSIDLGTVPAGLGNTHSVTLHSDDAPAFEITKVISQPPFADARLSQDHRTVFVALSPDSQWGLQAGRLVLRTNSAGEPKEVVDVRANVLGAVRPSDNPYALGSLRTNKNNVITVPLTSMDGKPFKVGKITLDRIAGDVSVGPCVNARPGCRLVSLVLSKDQPTGNLGSQMHIELPDYHKTLTVGFWGILLKPDTKIIDLDKAQDETAKGAKSKVVDGPVDFGKALKKSSTPPVLPPADPPGDGPVLRWSVANEQSLYGYLIYRSEHKDGPWRRVNDKIIPVLGHDDATSEYAWRDTSAVKGKTYWYFIKTLANNGSKQKLTEAHKVVAH